MTLSMELKTLSEPCAVEDYITLPATSQYVSTSSVQEKSTTFQHYNVKIVRVCAIIQIVTGSLCALFQIAYTAIRERDSFLGFSGILFIIAGIVGFRSTYSRTKFSIVSFMVLSIFSIIVTVILVFSSLILIAIESSRYEIDPDLFANITEYASNSPPFYLQKERIALQICIVFLGFMEGIFALLSSGLACDGVCCYKSEPGVIVVRGQVPYDRPKADIVMDKKQEDTTGDAPPRRRSKGSSRQRTSVPRAQSHLHTLTEGEGDPKVQKRNSRPPSSSRTSRTRSTSRKPETHEEA